MSTGEFNCPYCDIDMPHDHQCVDQAELELMRGCQRAFELQLRAHVMNGAELFNIESRTNPVHGTGWMYDPRVSRSSKDATAWNKRSGSTEYSIATTQRLWIVWRDAWRAARLPQTTRGDQS